LVYTGFWFIQGFGLYKILVYSGFGLYRIVVYSGFDLYSVLVYSGFGLYRPNPWVNQNPVSTKT
jgi:hypothetical protein